MDKQYLPSDLLQNPLFIGIMVGRVFEFDQLRCVTFSSVELLTIFGYGILLLLSDSRNIFLVRHRHEYCRFCAVLMILMHNLMDEQFYLFGIQFGVCKLKKLTFLMNLHHTG